MTKPGTLMIIVSLLALGAGAVQANEGRSCVAQAREEFESCRNECTNDLKNERFLCRNIEPGCGRECLGRRESCIDTATQPLEECSEVCKSALIDAKAACHNSCGEDAACLDTCVDTAQVDAFTCRDDCRETFRSGGGPDAVEQCRVDFRACAADCPRPAR